MLEVPAIDTRAASIVSAGAGASCDAEAMTTAVAASSTAAVIACAERMMFRSVMTTGRATGVPARAHRFPENLLTKRFEWACTPGGFFARWEFFPGDSLELPFGAETFARTR